LARGQIHQPFLHTNRAAIAQIIFVALFVAMKFNKNITQYGAQCKRCSVKYSVKISRNVGETEQHLLRHLHYAGIFAHS
jgi:hypothetical protein